MPHHFVQVYKYHKKEKDMLKYLQINQYKAEYEIQNVVMTEGFKDVTIDLIALAAKYKDIDYNPERFPGAILRFTDPKGTVLLFSSGKYVITGLRQEKDGDIIVKRMRRQLAMAKIKVDAYDLKVSNIVVSGKVSEGLDLNLASIELENSVYEPEIFPGLVYRMNGFRPTFLLFSNGAFVCAGLKNESEIEPSIQHVCEQIQALNLNFERENSEKIEKDSNFL